MFEDADAHIDRILALVAKCPEPLQEKCFEILLSAYVGGIRHGALTPPPITNVSAPAQSGRQPLDNSEALSIPEPSKARFGATAARLKIDIHQLAALFDFQSDPFVYHALAVPGGSKPERTRNAALLLAAKSYLAAGAWSADWKEFRAMCVDQGCYDRANMQSYLNSKEAYFRTSSAADGIALSSAGVAAAESLLASLAAPETTKE